MALKSFGRGGSGAELPGSTPTPSPAPSPGGLTAFIDQGSEFEGKLQFRDTVRIDGRFRGEISSENTLIVGESGEIEATIHSKTVSISGSVEGDVIAETKVVLHKTARVNGNVETPALQIEEGAILNGQIKMATGGSGGNKLKTVPADSDPPKAKGEN
jgi:cytoskeletal protein CcmA (bactofilin family)